MVDVPFLERARVEADAAVVRAQLDLVEFTLLQAYASADRLDDARRMLLTMRDADHEVYTGVALLDARTGMRDLYVDRAIVHVGHISDEAIEEYVASGQWRGKAGAYNLAERLSAGWPITFEGDPGTIMGLPMRTLPGRLRAFAARAA